MSQGEWRCYLGKVSLEKNDLYPRYVIRAAVGHNEATVLVFSVDMKMSHN